MTISKAKKFLSLTGVLMIINIILVVALAVVGVKYYHQEALPLQQIDNALNAPVRNWEDQQGRTHAEKPAVDLDRKTAPVVLKSLYDSVTHALDIKDKQIESLRAFGTRTSGTIVPDATPIVQPDGKVTGCEISYGDQWFSIGGRVCTGNDSLGYIYSDSLHQARYWKRKKFLGVGVGKKRSYFDAYSLNPNTHVLGLTGVDITDYSYDRFSLSTYAGYRSMQQFQSFNAGLQLEIWFSKNISVEVDGEYYLQDGKLKPAVFGKAKLTLIKF